MSYRLIDILGPEGSTLALKEPDKFEDMAANPTAYRLLIKAAKGVIGDWLAFLKDGTLDYIHPDITASCAQFHFVRCKYFGADYPRYLSYAFTPEQLSTPGGRHGSFYDMLEDAVRTDRDNKAYGVVWLVRDDLSFRRMISAQMPVGDSRGVLDFPVTTAKALIEEHCPPGGRVLDPCHGWGGRFTGFLAATGPRAYVGVDPSPVAHAGLEKIKTFLGPFAEPEKKGQFIQAPYEDAVLEGKFDFAFTSPPYFNVEKYSGKEQSHARYGNFESWCKGFYWPLIKKTHQYLKPGAKFCLNVGSQQFPLRERGMEYGKRVGFKLVSSQAHIVKQNGLFKTSDEKGEVLLVFQK